MSGGCLRSSFDACFTGGILSARRRRQANQPHFCYEAATLRKLNLEQAKLLVLGDSMIGEPDSNLIQLLCPERAQPDEPDAT